LLGLFSPRDVLQALVMEKVICPASATERAQH